jgi:signal peptide peptidase SppA
MKTERLTRIRNAIYGQPWAIMQDHLEAICEIFERHVSMDSETLEARIIEVLAKSGVGGGQGQRLGFGEYEIVNGVAVLPLMGPIFPRSNMMTRMSGATSLEDFNAKFTDALSNKDVCSILIQSDSPGGSVSGLNEMASKVFAARNQSKPIVSVADGMMASAAYLLGSQCMECYCTEGAAVGSIGVVAVLEDNSRQKENLGIRSHVFRTGPLKCIGAGPITDAQIEEYDSMIQVYFDKFKSAVTRARDGIDIGAASTGAVWIGQRAEAMGLVDGISTVDEQLTRLGK